MATLRERLAGLGSLPALPATVIKLLRSTQRDDLGTAELERIVRGDEAIAAAVIRSANSAAMASRAESTVSLGESITRLGHRNLRRVVLTAGAVDLFGATGDDAYGVVRGELWRGALGGALAAEMIARRCGIEDPGTCFTAGLLRDIGKLALGALFGHDELAGAFAAPRPNDAAQLVVEREALSVDHAEIGYELATLWGLPDSLANAIRHHHEPSAAAVREPLYDVVHCADVMCCWLAIGAGHDGLAYTLDGRAARAVGFERGAVEELLVALRATLARVEDELSDGLGVGVT